MLGTLFYVSGSCERHSELTEEMYIPLRPIPKEDFSSLTFLSTGKVTNWQTKVLDTREVTQLDLPHQKNG